MKAPDALRAQYYITRLKIELDALYQKIQSYSFINSPTNFANRFASSLTRAIDQMLLPTIVFEIYEHRSCLEGNNPEQRYNSFFLKNECYTHQSVSIPKRYPFLFECVDRFIKDSFVNLSLCLDRLKNDYPDIFLSNQSNLEEVHPLESSDRHRNSQSLLLIFSNKKKLIYKPVDLQPDKLLQHFVDLIQLPYPFDIKCLNVIPKKSYGWIHYLEQMECLSVKELQDFYRRMGALLAIADALNYTDGHFENLFVSGSYPILLDGETLFQNYAMPVPEHKNILSTLLLQKVDAESKKIYSALQTQSEFKIEGYHTYAINDHRDDISIGYTCLSTDDFHHVPIYKSKRQEAYNFKDFIIEGYRFAYNWISQKTGMILGQTSWWEQINTVQSRTVLRETAAYYYLLRRVQQPDLIRKREHAYSFLQTKLGKSDYTEYEIQDLLDTNIPYFYHYPGSRHIYDGSGGCYMNAFSDTAINCMIHQFQSRSNEKMEFDCKIINRHLVPLPKAI